MRIYSIKASTSAKTTPGQKSFLSRFLRILGRQLKKLSLGGWLFRACALGAAGVAILFIYFSFTLPDPNTLLQRVVPESTKIYDRNQKLLYEIHGEAKRTLVPLDQISSDLKNATVAVEDKNFYQHSGVAFRSLARAIFKDLTSASKRQGGSTITQQFVKNALLTRDKKWIRKLKEVILSVEIEARYSKPEILQLYLNEIPYGRNAYGVEAASQTYFGKSAKELSLAESAYLAAMPQSPTFFNPFGPNRQALDNRQRLILSLMQQQGYISAEQQKTAADSVVSFLPPKNNLKAPHFVQYIQDYLAKQYGEQSLEQDGLSVYTSLDLDIQTAAEKAIADRAEKNASLYRAGNAALVAIDPQTGEILAMVGSKNFFGKSEPAGCAPGVDCVFDPSVNVALSPRQPGSSFKPYVYLTAFTDKFGYAPASMLMDVVTDFGGGYIPHNYTGDEFGPVSMRQALAGSLNIPAVKTLSLVGVDAALRTAKSLGLTGEFKDCGLSLVLGGCDVRLLDHVAAYATLASGGVRHKLTPVLKILDRRGKILEEYKPDAGERVVNDQAVYELINIMKDNNARSYIFGVNNPLTLPGRELACKTGTTNEWRDGWTLCFTPNIAVGVWTGNNDFKQPMSRRADGVVVAAPIVQNFLKTVLRDKPSAPFPVPAGIKTVTVDAVSGKLPTAFTENTKNEIFASFAVPTTYDDVHVAAKIDKITGEAATNLTPPENIELRFYTVFKSERPNLANWEEPVRRWMAKRNFVIPPAESEYRFDDTTNLEDIKLRFISPQAGSLISAPEFTVAVNVSPSDNQIARLEVLLNGQLVVSKSNGPYIYQVSKPASGQANLALRAITTSGKTKELSMPVWFADTNEILITKPTNNSSLRGPIALEAISPINHGPLTFYLNNQNIGTSESAPRDTGGYLYSLLLDTPEPGSYNLQALAPSSQSSSVGFSVAE